MKTGRLILVWIILVTLTVFSFEFFVNLGSAIGARVAEMSIIFVTFIKVRMIGLEYMDLRRAPLPLRVIFEVWVIALWLLLSAIFYTSEPFTY